jgi:hypothetical protein
MEKDDMEAFQMQGRHGWRHQAVHGRPGKTRLRWATTVVAVALCALAWIPASAFATAPAATTKAAIGVRYEEATLKGIVNPNGSATNYWFEYGETVFYGTKVPVAGQSVGSGTSDVYVSQAISGLKQSTEYHFRIVAENESGMSKGEDASFTTTGFNFSFGKAGSGEGQLSEPYGAAVDSKGNVWVTDTANDRIEEFSAEGKYLFSFGKEGTGLNAEFKSPTDIDIDDEGRLWIVDTGNDRVLEYTTTGKYSGAIGKSGSGNGEFESPMGIEVGKGSQPTVYVADTGNDRVQKLNWFGKWLATFGEAGSGDGQFKSPHDVVLHGSSIWVTDTGNDRLEKFNLINLNYIAKLGAKGAGEFQFEVPTTIVSDFQESFWIADSGNDRAVRVDNDGNWLDEVGEAGTGPGQFSNPTGIVSSAPQKILVVDSGNDRVQGWSVKADAPNVVKKPATEITATTAVLNASIDPKALATTYWFEYGPTTEYGTKVPLTPESIGSGSEFVKVSQVATGLTPGVTYHYRAVAESSAGRAEGEDAKFKLTAPTAITESATAIKATQATLNGKVNPNSSLTSYWFEYGTKKGVFEAKIPSTPESVGSGSANASVNQTPTVLSKNTEYFFRLVAENEGGTTFGKELAFKTEP